MANGTCAARDCDRPARTRGWCGSHYGLWHKYGNALVGKEALSLRDGACVVIECGKQISDQGLCESHLAHRREFGSPVAKPRKKQPKHGSMAMYGRGCRCDACKVAATTYRAEQRDRNPEKAADYFRNWHLQNKERRNARRLELYYENKLRELAAARKYLYGLTAEDLDALMAAQGGVCAICGSQPDPVRGLDVDHDHACCPGKQSCGKCIRGLLCNSCNLAIGKLRDDPAMLRRAADYLEGTLPSAVSAA